MNKLSIIFSICFAFVVQTWLWMGCGNNPAESDKTLPTVVITQPLNGVSLTAPMTIKVEATDNEGVREVQFLIDNQLLGEDATAPYEQFWNVSFWADGDLHSVSAKAIDNSGNVSLPNIISVTVSQDAMVLPELVSPTNDSTIVDKDQVTFVWRTLPSASNFEIAVSSKPDFAETEYSTTIIDTTTTTTLIEGNHHWRVRAQNALGLWGNWSTSWQFRVVFVLGQTFGAGGGNFVQQTNDGGNIIVGTTRSFGAGEEDAWLIKTDPMGAEQWSHTFGGNDLDVGNAVKQVNDGGYIFVGRTISFGSGSSDFWLVKTDANGNEQWNQTFGGTEFDIAFSVVQTVDGGYILTGYTNSFGNGKADVWLIKTDANGNEQWSRTFGGTEDDVGHAVQQTTDGGYILVGLSRSFGSGGSDVWLLKTDENGNENWNRSFGGNNDERGFSVQQTVDGGYVIVGETRSFGSGNSAVWLIKTDFNGVQLWDKTFGGTSYDEGRAIQQTTDGGFIVLAATRSFGEGKSDLWLIKTDDSGLEQWNKTFGGIEDDFPGFSVQQTSDGGYIMTGTTQSFVNRIGDVWLIVTDNQGNIIN